MEIIKPSYEIKSCPLDACKRIEDIARHCYKSHDRMKEGSDIAMVRMLVKRKHEAMLEHGGMISVLFISDRGFSHELVRMRIASFAQESTRFCDYGGKGITLIHPPGLTELQYNRREDFFWQTQALYDLEREEGVLPEIARGVLPTCLKTEIVISTNIREWRHIFNLRAVGTTGKPHPQMSELMVPLLVDLKSKIPVVFDDIRMPE